MATFCAQDEVDIICDQCETFHNVYLYCRYCCVNVCDNCSKSHHRLHENKLRVSQERRREMHHFNVKCDKHNDIFRFFCKMCRMNVCEKCLKSDHKDHEVTNVSDHAQALKQNFTTNIDEKKKYCIAYLESVKQHELNFKDLTVRQIDIVRVEKENKRKLLNEEEMEIIENLKYVEENACKAIRDHYQKTKNINAELNDIIVANNKTLSIIPDAAVNNYVQEFESKIENSTSDMVLYLPNPPTFAPSCHRDQGGNLLGDLKSSKPTPPFLRSELLVLNTFTPADDAFVTNVCATDDDMFWVGLSGPLLLLIDKEGDIKVNVTIPGWPYYIAVTCHGDVIVSTADKVIYHVTRQGDISTFADVSPNEVVGITTTRQGEVFACIRVSSSEYKVRKFSVDGHFVLDVDRNILTGRVQWCVHNVGGDIMCIQDGTPGTDDECNLTLVDTTGQLVSRVLRTNELREVTKMMVWDRHGQIVTGTELNEYIHVFSRDGTCLKSYHVKDSSGIWGMCLGRDGTLLIGTLTDFN